MLVSATSMADASVNNSEEMRRVCAYVTLECGVSGDLCGETQAEFKRNLSWSINYFCNGGRASLL
jgi:hypothetical protein